MTRSFFIIVIFLALSCQINEKSEKRYNYLALGDSYTIAESLNLIDSYPHQLKNQLKKIDSVNIIAKTGWTTGELIDTLKSLNINKPIWVTEAMTCGPPVKAYVSAFSKGAEVIIDVGVNAPGAKMSKKGRKKLNEFIEQVDGFKSMRIITKNKSAEFTMQNGSKKMIEF